MTTQPEALRLIQQIDDYYCEDWDGEAISAELRRLHEVNHDLLEALKLADAVLSGANMNTSIVEKKVRAAIAKSTRGTP